MGIRVNSVTMQVRVSDIGQGAAFYAQLLGRAPDLDADPKFKEWQVLPDCWLQVAEGGPPMQGRMRFGVDDIAGRREWVQGALRVEVSPVEQVEGLVAWCNFDDPWGNRLGLFQDLAVPVER